MSLSGLAKIYGAAAGLKNLLYDESLVLPVRLPVPVVSVGNLSVGGTGKTPVVLHLSRNLPRRLGSRRGVVITRSYRASLTSPQEVRLGLADGAQIFGDEAVELAEKGALPVVSGPNKTASALYAYERLNSDFLLVDDGFQHRRLARDFDLVLLDPTDQKQALLPAGRLREGFSSLHRADAVLLTKVNRATPEQKELLRQKIPPTVPVFEAEFHWSQRQLFRQKSFGRPVAVLSALARNDLFQRQLEDELGRPPDQVWSYPDHYHYQAQDFSLCQQWLAKYPDGLIVTTGKDEVKLRLLQGTSLSPACWWVSAQEVHLQNENGLYDLIAKTLEERRRDGGPMRLPHRGSR